MDITDRWMKAGDARRKALAELGTLGNHYAPVINPMFMGGPQWPSRPGYQEVTLEDGGLVMCTNGLSDALESDPDGVGLGLEVYMAGRGPFPEPKNSWVFGAVMELGDTCAGHGGVRGLLDEIGALTVELSSPGFPDAYILESGRVCVLLGAEGPLDRVELPNGEIRFVCASVLTPAQYAEVMEVGDARRAELASELDWISG